MRSKQILHMSIFFITFYTYWIKVAELSPKCYAPFTQYLYFVTMCKIDPVIPLYSLDEICKSFFHIFNTTCTAMKLLHQWRVPGDQLYFMSEMT